MLQALEIVRVASVIGRGVRSRTPRRGGAVERGPRAGDRRAGGRGPRRSRPRVAPTIAYRFTHALTQEVCYDSLVGHQRKMLHGAIGRALASTHAKRMDEGAALLAHHFGRAEDWPAAIRFGRRAAERAIALSQFADALATLDQVLEWVGRLPGSGQSDLDRRSAAPAGACCARRWDFARVSSRSSTR